MMKFVLISDTHGQHQNLNLPEGDVIIHAGDFCHYGSETHLHEFMYWFGKQEFDHKILVCGNHDFFAAERPEAFESLLPDDVVCLCDSGTSINGIKIWGSPYQPDLIGWAFGKKRGYAMKKHWDLIPKDTDLLVTHTPPFGILDKATNGTSLGCEELSNRLKQLEIKVHVFGHVHSSYGEMTIGNTKFINGSSTNSFRGLVNDPVVFEM